MTLAAGTRLGPYEITAPLSVGGMLPFPDTLRARTRISADGGQNATWAPDGKTLFYCRGQAMMAVSVRTGSRTCGGLRR